jgi:hypothetical protein
MIALITHVFAAAAAGFPLIYLLGGSLLGVIVVFVGPKIFR